MQTSPSDDDSDFLTNASESINEPSDPEEFPTEMPNKIRKRVRRENMWKKNINKRLRNSGKQYFTIKGQMREVKAVQPLNNHMCRYACSAFTEEERQDIFEKYWQLNSWNLQSSFLTGCMEPFTPKRVCQTAATHKSSSVLLKLKGKRICKFFLQILQTLNISIKRYDNILKKRDATGVPPKDKRGKYVPENKMPEEKTV